MIAEENLSPRRARARSLWARLSAFVHNSPDKIRSSDWASQDLMHGMEHVHHVNFESPVYHVSFNPNSKEFACIDAKNITHIYFSDGRLKESFKIQQGLKGLVYASKIDQYVAWTSCSFLMVLNARFQILSAVKSSQDINCCHYNEELNEMVTASKGNVSTWRFFFGYRDLICHKFIGLSNSDNFTYLALERPLIRLQRCFAVSGTGVALLDLHSGNLLSFKRNLHPRRITGIAFAFSLQFVATCSSDGTVKVWDMDWNLHMVFVGHEGPVTAMEVHPYGPYLLTASEDLTIRTWSLELQDQVDVTATLETVRCLGTQKGQDCIFSFSRHRLDLWRIRHLYRLHTSIGHPILAIKVVNLPGSHRYPVRALCLCGDSTARLLASESGDVLTTLLLKPGQQVVDAEYCLLREMVLALTDMGDVLMASALTNPMEVLLELPRHTLPSRPLCLCIYTFTVDEEKTYHSWLEVVTGKEDEKKSGGPGQNKDRFLPILGDEDGFLTVLNMLSGETEYRIPAHESATITHVIANPDNSNLISIGSDSTVKVWRVFPYASESLSLQMTFYNSHMPAHLCTINSLFAVALQSPASVTYTIVLYNLNSKIRYDHEPIDDPKDSITDMSACPMLKIFATGSKDGTIKIWDHKNKLLRTLHLQSVPHCLVFYNDWGDLLVGLNRNVYRIKHEDYISDEYIPQMEPLDDDPIPIPESMFESMSEDSRQRLMRPKAENSVEDSLETALQDDPILKAQRVEVAKECALLELRNQDLRLLEQGEIRKPRKKRTEEIKSEAFLEYMKYLHSELPNIELPEMDVLGAEDPPPEPPPDREAPYVQLNIRKGFFPNLRQTVPWEDMTGREKRERGFPVDAEPPIIPILLCGFIPNSVFVRLFWPMEEEEPMDLRQMITELQRRSIQNVGIYEELLSLNEKTFKDIFEQALADIIEPQMEEPKQEFPLLPIPAKSRAGFRKPKVWKARLSPQMSQYTVDPEPLEPVPFHIPGYILQFKQEEWFKKIFSNEDTKNLLSTLSLQDFMKVLCEYLKKVDFRYKIGIMKALVVLQATAGPSSAQGPHDAIFYILNHETPPNQKVPIQRDFIEVALWALKQMNAFSKELLVELMVQFVQADQKSRKKIQGHLMDVGLQDPHSYFLKELETWNKPVNNKAQLGKKCSSWLLKWNQTFQDHVTDFLHDQLFNDPSLSHTEDPDIVPLRSASTLPKGIALLDLRKLMFPEIMTPPQERITEHSGLRGSYTYLHFPLILPDAAGKDAEQLKASASIIASSIAKLPLIDTVNYFCDVQLDKEVKAKEKVIKFFKEGKHKSVLLPPKIVKFKPIVRLGEIVGAVTMKYPFYFPLPSIAAHTHFMNNRFLRLPLKKIQIYPFPSEVDQYPGPHVLITLRHGNQKYFMLARSYVRPTK